MDLKVKLFTAASALLPSATAFASISHGVAEKSPVSVILVPTPKETVC